jgi:hypothetical protein
MTTMQCGPSSSKPTIPPFDQLKAQRPKLSAQLGRP